MDEHEPGESMFVITLLITALFCFLRVFPWILASLFWGHLFYRAVRDSQEARMRLLIVPALIFALLCLLFGLPGHPENGLLLSTLWLPYQQVILFLQAKYNVILMRPFTFQGVTPRDASQFVYWPLLGGLPVVGVLVLRKAESNLGLVLYWLFQSVVLEATRPVDWIMAWTWVLGRRSQRWVSILCFCSACVLGGWILLARTHMPARYADLYGVVGLLAVAYRRSFIPKPEVQDDKVWIGRDESKQPFALTLSQLNHHVHVLGESGFGKTVFLSHIIRHHIDHGLGFILIDLKADKENLSRVLSDVNKAGRMADLQYFSCANPQWSAPYNLCLYGNATEIKDKVIGGFTWSEPYYKKISEEAVLTICSGLVTLRDQRATPFTLGDVHACLVSPERITQVALALPARETALKSLLTALAAKLRSSKDSHDLAGLRSDLALLIQSDFGHLLTSPKAGIDLFKAIKERKMVYLSLEALKYGESALRLGKMILQDLKSVSAKVMAEIPAESRQHFTVVIDEFAELASPQFAGFIRMARGSKIGIIMAHQELADLEAISPELRDQVVGNAATTVSFLQKNPRSAQMMADIAGTRTTVKRTKQLQNGFLFESYSGAESEREVEEYLVHPNQIKTLRVGECFVISKHPVSRQAWIKVSQLEKPTSNVNLAALLGHHGDEKEETVEHEAARVSVLESDLVDEGFY